DSKSFNTMAITLVVPIKPVEQCIPHMGRDATTGIRDHNFNFLICLRKHHRHATMVRCEFNSIANEVKQTDFQFFPVAEHLHPLHTADKPIGYVTRCGM